MAHVRKAKLDREFHSLQSVLDETRPIRYIEHPNAKAAITPFVGNRIKICEAFGFEIPEGCVPEYFARKTTKGMRGRPRKNKLVYKELLCSIMKAAHSYATIPLALYMEPGMASS